MLVTWNHGSDGIGTAETGSIAQLCGAASLAASSRAAAVAEKRLRPARGVMVGVLGSLGIWTVIGAALLVV